MSINEVIELVEAETGTSINVTAHTTADLFARYVVITLLNEEGYKKSEIASVFSFERTGIYRALKVIDSLLITNKQFKKMYLACIARMAQMEETV